MFSQVSLPTRCRSMLIPRDIAYTGSGSGRQHVLRLRFWQTPATAPGTLRGVPLRPPAEPRKPRQCGSMRANHHRDVPFGAAAAARFTPRVPGTVGRHGASSFAAADRSDSALTTAALFAGLGRRATPASPLAVLRPTQAARRNLPGPAVKQTVYGTRCVLAETAL